MILAGCVVVCDLGLQGSCHFSYLSSITSMRNGGREKGDWGGEEEMSLLRARGSG